MQRRRITPIALGILLLFGAVAVRLVWMQGFHWREHHLEAESIRRATRFQMAPRGRILDRRDVVLAHDVPVHELVFLLKEIEPVRWVARRLARDLGPAHPERGFPYDEEALWSSLEELRDRLRPLLGGDEPIPRHLWLRRLDSRLAKRAARRVRDRPQHYPGIDVVITPEEGRIYVRPGDLFAGEAGVRRMERFLDLRAGDLVARVREAYLQV
ncbi:MAG: hypothetical protein ACE5GW_14395, partial [Planctomycetota bacterium]